MKYSLVFWTPKGGEEGPYQPVKATLEFQIPEDTVDFDLVLHGHVLHTAILSIREHLRSRRKYAVLTGEAAYEIKLVEDVLAAGMEALPESLR